MQAESVIQGITDKAVELHKRGQFNEALDLYNKLLNRAPDSNQLLFFMADAYLRKEYNGLAINLLLNVIRRNGRDSQAWCNLGVGYRKEGMTDEARAAWLKAISISGDTEEVCGNMAGLYADRGEPKEALHWCDRAIECNPDSVQAHWHKALAMLTLHDFADGWEHYEWRRKQEKWDSRKAIDAPDWRGESLAHGDHLYLHGEQGVGDEVMFLQCIPETIERCLGAEITIEVNKKVALLVKQTWPEINVVESVQQAAGAYTHKLPLGSLPKLFWKSRKDITGETYLETDDYLESYYFSQLTEIGPRPWVALAWMGGAKQTNVLGRSIPVDTYKPLMDAFTCVSGQYEDVVPMVGEERSRIGLPMIDLMASGGDLASQAALFKVCDAVVTVPQTAMHVAGAVGTKCYVLTPNNADWRFGLAGSEFPYYNSVEPIRKGDRATWGFAIERLLSEIKSMVPPCSFQKSTGT